MCIASRKWKSSISPGNDLVWLEDEANRGRSSDSRLTRRILTAKERLLVQVSSDPDRMLWSLWAAKEAAFKAVVRDRPCTVFSPQQFEVDPGGPNRESNVRFDDLRLPLRWRQGPAWVHAWVGTEQTMATAVERRPDGLDESTAVRRLAQALMASVGLGAGTIADHPPVFLAMDGDRWPVSLSHDGPWIAVSSPRPSR